MHAAAKKKDYSVAAAILVSLLLRLATVVSTTFIVLSPTEFPISNVDVTLNSKFVDDPSGLSETGPLAYTSLLGLVLTNILLPEGISTNNTYVLAEPHLNNTSELTAIVDGFFSDLLCEPATALPARRTMYELYPGYFTFRLKSDNCDMSINCEWAKNDGDISTGTRHSLCMSPGACGESSDTYDKRIGIVASDILDAHVMLTNDTHDPYDPWIRYEDFTIKQSMLSWCVLRPDRLAPARTRLAPI
ncbi:hypothetical protein GGR58DRAFT_521187 [Xylaria digitata]|nr:hypothetical protein GGR58DRAFT_521187 [Xylaria digitata]